LECGLRYLPILLALSILSKSINGQSKINNNPKANLPNSLIDIILVPESLNQISPNRTYNEIIRYSKYMNIEVE